MHLGLIIHTRYTCVGRHARAKHTTRGGLCGLIITSVLSQDEPARLFPIRWQIQRGLALHLVLQVAFIADLLGRFATRQLRIAWS